MSRLSGGGGWSSAEDVTLSSKQSKVDDSCSIFLDMTLFPSTTSRSYQSVRDAVGHSSTVPRSRKDISHFGGLDGPFSIAQMKNGNMVVAEWRGNSISIITKEGLRMLTFGRRLLSKESIIYNRLSGVPTKNYERHGTSLGELHEPTGLLVTKRNQILVTDSKNHRLQLFSSGGTPITTVGSHGDVKFQYPYDICSDVSGRLYISDPFNHQIQVLTEDFLLSHSIGERGSTFGRFEYPLGVAMDSEGMLYVCDRDNSRVQKMTCYGRTVAEFKHESLLYPVKVAVDGSNIVYVSYSYLPLVAMFDANTAEYIGSFSNQSKGGEELIRPRGILVDGTGKVFVCDTSRNEILIF